MVVWAVVWAGVKITYVCSWLLNYRLSNVYGTCSTMGVSGKRLFQKGGEINQPMVKFISEKSRTVQNKEILFKEESWQRIFPLPLTICVCVCVDLLTAQREASVIRAWRSAPT